MENLTGQADASVPTDPKEFAAWRKAQAFTGHLANMADWVQRDNETVERHGDTLGEKMLAVIAKTRADFVAAYQASLERSDARS